MDAAGEPLRQALPSDAGDKPKAAEPQDDGYETSNSGERPKPPSERGTPPPAPPEPPEHHYEHPGHHEHHEMLPQHEHPQQMQQQQQQQQQVYPQYRPYEPPQHEQPPQDHEPYHHFPFPKYGAPEQYFKRENDAPYDMSQQHYAPKRDDDPLYNGIKRECEDPYSFVEEEAMCAMLGGPQGQMPPHLHHQQHHDAHQHHQMMHAQQMMLNQPKKRGRKKKIKDENGMEIKVEPGMEGALVPRVVKERKKHDRFNGMSEEEVSRRTLPDHLQENLDIIIIGINPGLFAAYKGHHYAGPGNHFWKCLYLSGLTREQMSADEDYKLLNFGIGFTNMVARATKGSADLTRREIKEGSAILLEKLQTFRPKVAVFNGKLIYEVFSGKKDFCFGKQPDTITGTNTYMWVMPSSSARCAQLPRAADKVPFYAALKKFRDYLNGLVAHIEESELVFPDTTSRRPQDELEIRRLTQEPEPGETMILEDGTEVPLKKKRGRPKKVKLENGAVPPAPRPRPPRPAPLADGEQPPKKKRGRPKKVRPEDQQFLMQQQQPLEQPYLHHQLMPHGQAENVQQEQSSFGAGLGGAELGGGGMMYDAPAGDASTYYQQQNAGNSMDGSLGYARQTPVPASNPAPSYIEPRAVYSPAQPRHAQFAHSPAGAGAGAGASTPTYSPRPAGTPQPQFPQSPAAFSQPSPPRYAPAGAAPPYPPQYPPAPFHHPHYDSREPAPQPLRPFSRSPGPAPFPAASPAANSFTMSPAARSYSASPAYSTHSSPAPRTPHYAAAQTTPTPAAPGAGNLCGELSADMDSRSPPCALDFSPPSPADQQENQTSSVGSEMSVGGSCAPPAPARPFDAPYRRHGRLDSPRDHYQDQGQVAGSPQLDQMHQHQHPSMYGNNFNRSTPESSGGGATPSGVGSPFSAHAFRPPDAHPGSPGGEYQQQPKPKPQDVASKSLSGLESLVDQIPSIADGGGNAAGGSAQPGAEPVAAPPPALAEYPPSIYGPYGAYGGAAAAAYGNNGYGAPFVGYGGGWGGQLMRPTPGYLSDWQYGYGAGVAPGYAPYNTPYYNGYAGPPPAHHQQYLGAPPLLDLHKQEGGVPAVPSVPSVGFPGFC
ncbi:trithorax group protein osa isoform X3 [Plutella xylostella]|uniref:trithorax group protein osa isoform X3 n=1 Tax=Plutella xylostella TaxID=51655 RepID=UPI002032292D|nr:trithorax group protein osa isoform X3 [Plutella xylostella]